MIYILKQTVLEDEYTLFGSQIISVYGYASDMVRKCITLVGYSKTFKTLNLIENNDGAR